MSLTVFGTFNVREISPFFFPRPLLIISVPLHVLTLIFQGLIFAKNSPLTPVFKHALLRLREKGVIQQTYSLWEGSKIRVQKENGMSKTVLTAGQVIFSRNFIDLN